MQQILTLFCRFLGGKTSLCISSQVGCALKCSFCSTGAIGFKRQLTAEEITDQVLYFLQQVSNLLEILLIYKLNNALSTNVAALCCLVKYRARAYVKLL
jgi:adenine C2-methylase RlmN of 23S rRNA A2503 and tRNA A37